MEKRPRENHCRQPTRIVETIVKHEAESRSPSRNLVKTMRLCGYGSTQENNMGFGKGALLWLIGIPLPIIIILALFMHH